jgi:hypothetical protein
MTYGEDASPGTISKFTGDLHGSSEIFSSSEIFEIRIEARPDSSQNAGSA